MNRRSFLKLSALGGGAAAFLPTLNLLSSPTPFPRPFEAGDILYSQMLADKTGCGALIYHGFDDCFRIEFWENYGTVLRAQYLPKDAVHVDRLIQDYVLPQNKNIPPRFIGEMQKTTARRNQRRTQ